MSAPIDHNKSEIDRYDDALQRASKWRGDCIQQFAELEKSIGDALQLIAASRTSSKVKCNGLIRQQFDELKKLTSAKASKVHFVAKSLCEIDRLIEWRAHLTHGILGVWQGSKGQWLLTLQHRDANGGPLRLHALPWSEAEQKLELLSQEVDTFQKRVVSMNLVLNPKTA